MKSHAHCSLLTGLRWGRKKPPEDLKPTFHYKKVLAKKPAFSAIGAIDKTQNIIRYQKDIRTWMCNNRGLQNPQQTFYRPASPLLKYQKYVATILSLFFYIPKYFTKLFRISKINHANLHANCSYRNYIRT